jgi:hypothetical protein
VVCGDDGLFPELVHRFATEGSLHNGVSEHYHAAGITVWGITLSLPAFDNFRGVWVEKTKASHGHGGEGWEFGTCLWSPATDKSGKRIYENMT